MNKKRLFFNFLQKHNALEAYKRALKASIGIHDVRAHEYIPLRSSFIWACTPEGHEYWKALYIKWAYYSKSINTKYHF